MRSARADTPDEPDRGLLGDVMNELDDRPLAEPALQRLPAGAPRRAEIIAAHDAALAAGAAGYDDPATGLFVLTAAYLAARGYCCGRGCRHCPYVRDTSARDPAVRDPAVRDPAVRDPAVRDPDR